MLVIDNLLLSPARALFWIFREIHNAAQQEFINEAESITTELSELYMMLETDRITEAEFDAREKDLLDRLDRINEVGEETNEENDEEDEDL